MSEVSEVAAALTADLIVDGDQAADPVVSPDGRWVAWTTSLVGEWERRVSDLWLAPVGECAAPVTLTDGSVRARLPRWSLDSAWLFYVADGELRRLGSLPAGRPETPGWCCAGVARSPGWLRSRADGWWPSWPVTS